MAITLTIEKLTRDNYGAWNEFCLNSSTAWFRHTTYFLDYILESRFNDLSENHSFMLYEGKKLIAIVPLITQTIYPHDDKFEFGMLDTDIPFPAFCDSLSEKVKNHVLKIIMSEISNIVKIKDIIYDRFFVEYLTDEIILSKRKSNPLLKIGYLDQTFSSNIVSLKKDIEDVFRTFRKGHKADIKRAAKRGFVVDIFDNSNITKELLEEFEQLHFLDAGRKTRPSASWLCMLDWIKKGFAVLALEKGDEGDLYISGALILVYKKMAYYGSSATHPQFAKSTGVGHLIQWELIKYLKEQHFEYYDMGLNVYKPYSKIDGNSKEESISHFKSGFGGEQYPVFRGLKFYDKDFFCQQNELFVKEYVNTMI